MYTNVEKAEEERLKYFKQYATHPVQLKLQPKMDI